MRKRNLAAVAAIAALVATTWAAAPAQAKQESSPVRIDAMRRPDRSGTQPEDDRSADDWRSRHGSAVGADACERSMPRQGQHPPSRSIRTRSSASR